MIRMIILVIFDQTIDFSFRKHSIFDMMIKNPQGFIAILINFDQNCYKSLGNFDHHVKILKGKSVFLIKNWEFILGWCSSLDQTWWNMMNTWSNLMNFEEIWSNPPFSLFLDPRWMWVVWSWAPPRGFVGDFLSRVGHFPESRANSTPPSRLRRLRSCPRGLSCGPQKELKLYEFLGLGDRHVKKQWEFLGFGYHHAKKQ